MILSAGMKYTSGMCCVCQFFFLIVVYDMFL